MINNKDNEIIYFGYYDKTAKNYVKFFSDYDGATAIRTAKQFISVMAQQNELFIRDLELHALYSVSLSSGKPVSIFEESEKVVFVFNDYLNLIDKMEEKNNGEK